jgi:hypothetical protein
LRPEDEFTADQRGFDGPLRATCLSSIVGAPFEAREAEEAMRKVNSNKIAQRPVPAIEDNGKVRLGFLSPSLPPVRVAPANTEDQGKVRLGFLSPSLPPVRVAPANTGDQGKVRLGFLSPSLPPVRIAPANVEDKGKVRLGYLSPSL